uniref:DPH-type MB domain-containing protein n=1 Tax=Octactis speculum TaxID=3111310 RepID=A0A7S2HHD6_9STRA
MDHYSVLGVSRAAPLSKLRESYYAQARKCHPDKMRSATDSSPFHAVQAAWDTLSEPESRSAYDEALAAAEACAPSLVTSSSKAAGATAYAWECVRLDQMDYDDEEELYSYPCRCGDCFEFGDDEMTVSVGETHTEGQHTQGNQFIEFMLPCSGCSLKLHLTNVPCADSRPPPELANQDVV